MYGRVLILHGWNGSDAPHWQAWLAEKLQKEGHIVSFPSLPDRDNPDKEKWLDFIAKEAERFKPDAVVCHSLGCTAWLHLLGSRDLPVVQKLLLVAPPHDARGNSEIEAFFPAPLPEDLKAETALLVLSDSDKYMSMKEAKTLMDGLKIKTKILTEAGHINSDSGFGPLPLAYEFLISE